MSNFWKKGLIEIELKLISNLPINGLKDQWVIFLQLRIIKKLHEKLKVQLRTY